jgi:FAD/FMN-containing dehydrogenase
MTRSEADWEQLGPAIGGTVVRPHSPEYDELRTPAMLRFHDIKPEAIVLCASPQDVSETIAFARRHALEIGIRSGGHSVAGRSSTEGLLIDVTPMDAVSLEGGVATVGAGVRLGALEDACEPLGLTIPAGSSHSVGIAGLTLGGGLGILGRTHGLTSDHLLEAEIVLADGRTVVCDEHDHADLFWALRGAGGGSLGVVTSLVFRTVPAPATTVFHATWDVRSAVALIDAWQRWAPDGPDELDATLRLNLDGGLDGSRTLDVFGAYLGTETEASELLGTLAADSKAEPESSAFRHGSYRTAKRYLDGLAPGEVWPDEGLPTRSSPRPGYLFTKSEFFRRTIPLETISALLADLLEGIGRGETREVTFTPWRGAYNRVPAGATAFVHRDERSIVQHLSSVDPDVNAAGRDLARGWLARSWGLVHPWGSGGVYPNFPDPDLDDSRVYLGDNDDRFQRVKARYDPDGLFDRPSAHPQRDRRPRSS